MLQLSDESWWVSLVVGCESVVPVSLCQNYFLPSWSWSQHSCCVCFIGFFFILAVVPKVLVAHKFCIVFVRYQQNILLPRPPPGSEITKERQSLNLNKAILLKNYLSNTWTSLLPLPLTMKCSKQKQCHILWGWIRQFHSITPRHCPGFTCTCLKSQMNHLCSSPPWHLTTHASNGNSA